MNVSKTQYKVSDFLNWQRDGTLTLSPNFQRRPVWKPGAKSFLLDTVVRGLPVPIIFIRDRLNLAKQRTEREVVDGQQRLRTLIAFIDSSSLQDFEMERDTFTVTRTHNPDIAGRTFSELDESTRSSILSYEFSVHILPPEFEDREVLKIFQRLNSTGTRLEYQELRNAEWFGEFKTSMYGLAYEQLDRWRDWTIFSEDNIARMKEVELTSDLVGNMMMGLRGKSQASIGKLYADFDANFEQRPSVEKRFRQTFDAIDDLLGSSIQETVYVSDVHFFTLFTFVYDLLWGLGSPMDRTHARPLPDRIRQLLLSVSERFEEKSVPPEVFDAVARASTDKGRRQTRLDYMKKLFNEQVGA